MPDDKSIKLFTAAKELNIGVGTVVDFLSTKGFKVQKHPMTLLDGDMYNALLKEFAADKIIKEEAKQISIGKIRKEDGVPLPERPVEQRRSRDFENEEILIKNTGHHFTPPAAEKPKPVEPPHVKADDHGETLPGVKVVGKIDLNNVGKAQPAEKPVEKKPEEPVKNETPAPAPVKETPVPVQPQQERAQPQAEQPKPAPQPAPVTARSPK
jgi:translation initiation factor IF-2